MKLAPSEAEMIRSERLDLVWLRPDTISSLLEGRRDEAERLGGFALPEDWPDDHDRRFLSFRLRQATEDPAQSPWLVRAIVLRGETRPMIGHIGFHGGPGRNSRRDPDALEVGYTIFEEFRRRRYATEAVQALLGWGQERGVWRFIASVGPENQPSLALVRRLGFREVGRHWDDEDGEELEFELVTEINAGS
ncbi:MAG: GNAT family N-acetyltransferase [Gaiellaceae bacterium]